MKLLNISFTKPRYLVLGIALAAGASSIQAQHTGIGTVTPTAALHIARFLTPTDSTSAVDSVSAGGEMIRIQGVKNLRATQKAAYGEVLVYNSATGLFRRESIADILNDNGEWVWDGTKLAPRRTTIQHELNIVNGAVAIGNATRSANLTVTGNGTYSGNLTVDGNTALATGVGDVVTLANLTRIPLANVGAGIHVMIRDTANANQVRYAQLGNLMEANGMWVENAGKTELLPRVATYSGTIGVTADTVFMKKGAAIAGKAVVGGEIWLKNVPHTATIPVAQDDEILMQRKDQNRVEHVTVAELLTNSSEWRFRAAVAAVNPDLIYANRAKVAGNEIVATDAGRFGIGTAQPSEKLQIVGGNIQLDEAASVKFGTDNSLASTSLGVTLTSSGTYAEVVTGAHSLAAASSATTATGIITFRSGSGAAPLSPTVTINANGLGIGVVAGSGRHLQTNLADGLEFGSLTAVNDVTTAGTSGNYDRVLITDGNGVVRFISADDLVATASEWTFEDTDNDDVFDAGEKIYLRRLGNDGSGDDVYIDAVGNIVASTAKAFQWGGGAANQISKTGITVDGAFKVETGSASAVSFQENGSAIPWLHFDATNGGTGAGAYLGRVGIGTNAPLAALHVVGNIIASNTAQTSDRRFKRDIVELSGALKAIRAIRGVSYEFRADEFPKEGFDEATHIGFIAQELREVLPHAVFEREDGYLTVDYSAVTPVLVEAMQELSAKVEALEAENAILRGGSKGAVGAVSTKQLQELEARLAAMDARLEAAAAGRK